MEFEGFEENGWSEWNIIKKKKKKNRLCMY